MKKLTPEEVEVIMVPRLIDALYPVLYPIEQQDMRIQEEHRAKVASIAKQVWRQFTSMEN